MKYGILGCIICLLLIGTVSAITVNPAIGKQTIQAPAVASVPVLNTAAITFDSSVQGATVYLDGKLLGADGAHSKTPVTDNTVTAGDHSATFKLDGYQDSVMNFHVDAGKAQTMFARLQPLLSAGAVRQVQPGSTRVQVQITGIQPVVITTPPEDKGVSRISPGITILQQVGTQDSSGGNEERALPESQRLPVAAIQPAPASNGFFDSIFGSIFGGLFGAAPKPPMGGNLTGPTIPPGTSFVFDAYWIAPVIDHGATIYIGEERLNVTHALNQAVGTNPATEPPAGYDDGVPTMTRIGWFQPDADPYTVSPSKTIDLGVGGRYRSMEVEPSDFVGYYGNWYLLDTSGIKPYGSYPVFIVRDPVLHLNVDNAATGADVNGALVTSGDQIRFSINKSIGVTDSTGNRRSPITNSPSDGFLDIVVTAPGSSTLTQLETISTGGSPGVADLKRLCWDDPAGSPCNPGYTWNTGAKYGNGTAKYPPGTYTVQVISKLNNMHNNYKNGGQLYVGKTVSEKVTFTLT